MAKFKNDKGLTLIELLITIAVLAVVSAIALPVINNVVSASNSNALNQTIKDANDFINKYSKSGVVAYDGLTKTFSGYVDTDGDNVIDSNEKIDTLTLDAKFSATANGTSATVGGSYSNGGVTSATITAANGGTTGGTTSQFGTASQKLSEGGLTIIEGMEWTQSTPVLYYDVANSTAYYTSSIMGYDVATLMSQPTTSFELYHAGIYPVYNTSEASSGHITVTLFGQTRHYYNVDASGNIIPFA